VQGRIGFPKPIDGGVMGIGIGAEIKVVVVDDHALDLETSVDEDLMAFAQLGWRELGAEDQGVKGEGAEADERHVKDSSEGERNYKSKGEWGSG
jgi:hypothetical protein